MFSSIADGVNVYKPSISVERQEGLRTSHLQTQIDPFATKLMMYDIAFYRDGWKE